MVAAFRYAAMNAGLGDRGLRLLVEEPVHLGVVTVGPSSDVVAHELALGPTGTPGDDQTEDECRHREHDDRHAARQQPAPSRRPSAGARSLSHQYTSVSPLCHLNSER